MLPSFCARLLAAAAANRFALTRVTVKDDSGRTFTVITNSYHFTPVTE